MIFIHVYHDNKMIHFIIWHNTTNNTTTNNMVELFKSLNVPNKYLEGLRLSEQQNLDWVDILKFFNDRSWITYTYTYTYTHEGKKYLFLDHQGVLNDSLSPPRTFNPLDIDQLNNILNNNDLKIIVSSDWTRFMSINDIINLYQSSGIKQLPIDFTDSSNHNNKLSIVENRARQIFNKINDLKLSFNECLIIDDLDLRPFFSDNNFIWIENGLGLKSLYNKLL